MKIISKLPPYFKNQPSFLRIAESLQKSSVNFPALFIHKQGVDHLCLKSQTGNVHIPLDWEEFSMIRCSSQTLITSGSVIKDEPNAYKSKESFGYKTIDQLYQTFNHISDLLVLTKSKTREELEKSVNPKCFNLKMPTKESVYDNIEEVVKGNKFPITIEFGMNLLNQYFTEVENGKKNYIDHLFLTKYEGECDNNLIGPTIPINISKFYDLQWTSEHYPCSLTNGNKGSIRFEIYSLKNQEKK